VHGRTWSQVGRFFAGCRLLQPGKIVWAPQWTRDGDEPETDPDVLANPGRSLSWCGVGVKLDPSLRAAPLNGYGNARPARQATRVQGPDAAGSAELRPDIPNVARMYDYMLGGKDNYPADREAARRTFAVLGEDVVRGTVQQNRQFLARAVRYLAAEKGIKQFLDIGTGLPTLNSVHEVARSVSPDSRVVYVDNDPVVLAHARHMLHAVPGTMIVNHDLRAPSTITDDPGVRSLLDFRRPIAVLLLGILHFLPDSDDPAGIVSTLMAAVPPGSCLAISHLTADHYAEKATCAAEVYNDTVPGLHLRSRAQVWPLFGGLPLLPPGQLSYTADWHPDADTAPASGPGGSAIWCGIAQKIAQK
jgi:hypothetical protein